MQMEKHAHGKTTLIRPETLSLVQSRLCFRWEMSIILLCKFSSKLLDHVRFISVNANQVPNSSKLLFASKISSE